MPFALIAGRDRDFRRVAANGVDSDVERPLPAVSRDDRSWPQADTSRTRRPRARTCIARIPVQSGTLFPELGITGVAKVTSGLTAHCRLPGLGQFAADPGRSPGAPPGAQSIRSYAGSVRNSTNVSSPMSSSKICAASSYLPSPYGVAEQRADLRELLGNHRGDHLLGDLAAVVEHALAASASTATPASARSRRSRRPPSGCRSAPRPAPRATRRCTGSPTLMLRRSPFSVIGASGSNSSRSAAPTLTSSRFFVAIWFGVGIRRSNASIATRNQARVRDPGAVVAVRRLALLVGLHLRERLVVGGRVVLHRDLRRHAAHRVDVAAVAGLDQQQRVARMKCVVIVTSARSARQKSWLLRNFLMQLKM